MIWRRWGRGRPIIVAHGGSGSWSHWIKTIPVLKDRYELWVVDLPGLGDSEMPHHPHTPESCGKAMALGITALIRASAVRTSWLSRLARTSPHSLFWKSRTGSRISRSRGALRWASGKALASIFRASSLA